MPPNYWITNKSVCLCSAFICDKLVGVSQGAAFIGLGLCPNAGIVQQNCRFDCACRTKIVENDSRTAVRATVGSHPDAKKDGSAGCIGIQNYDSCRQVTQSLRRYHGLKLKVQVP